MLFVSVILNQISDAPFSVIETIQFRIARKISDQSFKDG